MTDLYHFRLLRYTPNILSEEFCNIAALLYDVEGRLLDARFTPDFLRLRSNPVADLAYLDALREEFENRRLMGEGFSEYLAALVENLSLALQVSDEKSFLGENPLREIERLARTYLTTPRRRFARAAAALSESRRAILRRMKDVFEQHQLTEHLQSNVAVGAYVSPRFSFQIDYAYKPNGVTHYLHALSPKRDVQEAGRLCFVFDRLRVQTPTRLTAVVADALPEDTRALLESSQIHPWPVSKLHELAEAVRNDLRLN